MFILQVQLPPLFNLPKSQLQCFGESVYCIATDMLSRCNGSENPHDRFIAVVAWSISTVRPLVFGVAPYNPILGETHHVSRGSLNVLLEQVFALLFCTSYFFLQLWSWNLLNCNPFCRFHITHQYLPSMQPMRKKMLN